MVALVNEKVPGLTPIGAVAVYGAMYDTEVPVVASIPGTRLNTRLSPFGSTAPGLKLAGWLRQKNGVGIDVYTALELLNVVLFSVSTSCMVVDPGVRILVILLLLPAE